MDERLIERVAKAIESVQMFSRLNDWTSDARKGYPVEICRYGEAGEPEIVVVERYPAGMDEDEALREQVRKAMAIAAIEAMNR